MTRFSDWSASDRATGIGMLAILMWSFSSLMVSNLVSIPPLQLVMMVFTLTFLFTATRVTTQKRWHAMRQPIGLWVIGILGIAGNDITFFTAFHYAPAQHVELINYFWPVLVLLFASRVSGQKLSYFHITACLLGLCGVGLVLLDSEAVLSASPKLWLGYGLAFLDALIWASYTVLARRYAKRPVEMVGLYCGAGALLTGVLHVRLEPTVMPSLFQAGVIVIMAFSAHGLAYFFWDYGVKHGDYPLLSIVAYAGPVFAYLWLVLAGIAPYSGVLFLAAGLIACAGYLGTEPSFPRLWLRFRNWIASEVK